MRSFGNSWESMSDADKAPYFEEASKHNVLRDAYNKWKSMSGTVSVTYLQYVILILILTYNKLGSLIS